MRVLYGAPLGFGQTSEHRLRAFRRIVAGEVSELCFDDFFSPRQPRLRALGERTGFVCSPAVRAMNAALLRAVEQSSPDLVWLDKPIYFTADTIRSLTSRGVRVVSYMPDDPYGPRNDRGWRLFKQAMPHYWGHVVPRQVTLQEFRQRGATRIVSAPSAFEPSIHFPPSALGLSVSKTIDLSFVGSPLDDRPAWIARLARALKGIRIAVFGPGWHRHRSLMREAGIDCQGPVWNDQYRQVIWQSRLSLSFVTHANRDELSHKAIEIAACGTPVLLQPSPVHNTVFRHRDSAYFFSDPNALEQLATDALNRSEEHGRVGTAAARAVRSAQLSNDAVLTQALTSLGLFARPASLQPAVPGVAS